MRYLSKVLLGSSPILLKPTTADVVISFNHKLVSFEEVSNDEIRFVDSSPNRPFGVNRLSEDILDILGKFKETFGIEKSGILRDIFGMDNFDIDISDTLKSGKFIENFGIFIF